MANVTRPIAMNMWRKNTKTASEQKQRPKLEINLSHKN